MGWRESVGVRTHASEDRIVHVHLAVGGGYDETERYATRDGVAVGEPLIELLPERTIPESFIAEFRMKEAIQQAVAVRGYNIERDDEAIQHACQPIADIHGKYTLGLHLTNGT